MAMDSPAISKRSQLGLLYFLAFACDLLWPYEFVQMKRSVPLLIDVLGFCAPVLYLYFLIRFAAVHHRFIRHHPFSFYGALSLFFLPPLVFLSVIALLGTLIGS